jgi:hypothetical protein
LDCVTKSLRLKILIIFWYGNSNNSLFYWIMQFPESSLLSFCTGNCKTAKHWPLSEEPFSHIKKGSPQGGLIEVQMSKIYQCVRWKFYLFYRATGIRCRFGIENTYIVRYHSTINILHPVILSYLLPLLPLKKKLLPLLKLKGLLREHLPKRRGLRGLIRRLFCVDISRNCCRC